MKKFSLLVLLLAVSLIVMACGSSTSTENTSSNAGDSSSPAVTTPSTDADGPEAIRMQIVWATDSGRGEAIQRIIDEFEKQHDNIKVELLASTNSNQQLLTQILSGNAPDLIMVPYRQARSLGAEGAFVDLTDDFSSEKQYYYEQLWELGSVNNRLYGFPWLGHTIQLVYNKTLFDEAGLPGPPDTWEELYEYAKILTKDTNGDGRIDQYGLGLVGQQHHDITWLVNMFVNQAGAQLVIEENGTHKVGLNSPEGREALAFYKKLVDEVTPPDTSNKNGGDIMADFRNQVIAMEFQGPWGITDIWANGHPFEVASAPVPAGPAGRAADLGPNMLVIPVGTDAGKEKAAKTLIQYLSSKEAQEMIMLGELSADGNYYPFRVPMRKDLADADYFKKHPEFLVFIEGLQYPSISSPVESWLQVEEQVYQSALNQLVTGAKSIDEVLKLIEEEGNKILR